MGKNCYKSHKIKQIYPFLSEKHQKIAIFAKTVVISPFNGVFVRVFDACCRSAMKILCWEIMIDPVITKVKCVKKIWRINFDDKLKRL